MIKTTRIVFFVLLGMNWAMAQKGDPTEDFALQLLSRHSPDGAEIVQLGLELESRQSPFKVSEYIEPDTRRSLLSSLNTVVHEACHELTRFKGEEIAADSLDIPVERISNVLYFYLSESRFILVNRTKTFPSRDMVDTIPDRMRTFRFSYIDTPEVLQDLLPISQINNHLIFRIPRKPHLVNITPQSRVRFEISHRDGRYLFMDELLYTDQKILD
jgi:hypothetical protein